MSAKGLAEWDGVKEPAGPGFGLIAGQAPSLSFEVTLVDATETVLYRKRGGIQILGKATQKDRMLEHRPLDERAVRAALGELPARLP